MNRIVARDGRETLLALSKLKPGVIAFDTETTDLNWYRQELQGVSICDGETVVYIDITTFVSQLPHLRDFFDRVVFVIAHNITFDVKALYKCGINLFDKEWADTMVMEHLLNESGDKGLKKLAQHYLGAEVVGYETAAKSGVHSQKFAEYAMNDAEWTWNIFHIQKHRLEAEGLVPLMRDIEQPFLKALAEMEMNGINVDQPSLSEKTALLKELVFASQIKVLECAGVKPSIQMGLDGSRSIRASLDINSPQHLRELLYSKYKITPPATTKKGIPTTDRHALNAIKDQHPIVPLLLQYRKYAKLHTAFFEPLGKFIDGDGRVRPHFNDTGTHTGRLSCSSPNLQQQPKPKEDPLKTRALFVASPGFEIISCDYAGQEICILAHLSGDQTLIETLHKGYDLHLATARKFFNLDIPEEALRKGHVDYKKYVELFKKQRDQAKVINFGIAYGKGAYGFAQDFKISEEEAQKILDDYFAGFPGVKRAIDAARFSVIKNGYVTTMTGRRRRFQKSERNGEQFYVRANFREAFNFLIQGYAADMIRIATARVRELGQKHPEWNLRMLATVHDENIYEVKKEYAEVAENEIRRTFESAVQLSVPIIAETGRGESYAEAK